MKLKLTEIKNKFVWTTRLFSKKLFGVEDKRSIKKTERWLINNGLNLDLLKKSKLCDENGTPPKSKVLKGIIETSLKKRKCVLFATVFILSDDKSVLFANDGRNGRRWVFFKTKKLTNHNINHALELLALKEERDTLIIPTGSIVSYCRSIVRVWQSNQTTLVNNKILRLGLEIYSHGFKDIDSYIYGPKFSNVPNTYSHLDKLEAEAIYVMREVVAESDNPVMLYSVGKDSAVMLHLAQKAFYPSQPPFPLMHIDTQWKFRDMYNFRDYMAYKSNMKLLVYVNPDGIEKNINPFDHGSLLHTDIMKTQGLKKALDTYKFDVAFGGARRDEEKSRAKERIFSFRNNNHVWDPKNQRPELWQLYNCRKKSDESIRVFPLSNWTELDIWLYIYKEKIPIVPLYFAAERPVVSRDGMMIMIDDDRIELFKNEEIKLKKVRFRTLGCYPLTGAIKSDASDIASIILELQGIKTSERQGRVIDLDTSASMEKKKKEGYF